MHIGLFCLFSHHISRAQSFQDSGKSLNSFLGLHSSEDVGIAPRSLYSVRIAADRQTDQVL